MTGPIILIGTTPLWHGGILSVDITVLIIAFVHSFKCKLGIYHPFVYNNFFLCPKHMKVKTSFGYLCQK